MRSSPLLALGLVATALAIPAHATTWHVPSECPTIQAGVDSSAVGDTVLVACDTYYEHDIIMKSGVCLTGETGEASCVTIDAQQQGRVIYCLDVDDAASIVGFTLTGGLPAGGAATEDTVGGGVYCENSSPAFTSCTFAGNQALHGAGMACWENANPTLTNCTFTGNTGSGMLCASSAPTLTDCTFSGNTSVYEGGGGMGIYGSYDPPSSSPTLTNCTFSGNSGGNDGGGIDCGGSSPTLTDCTFSGNDAYTGGGLKLIGSSAELISCTFSDNVSEEDGGGMVCIESTPTLTDCEFSGNDGGTGGGMFSCESSLTLADCVFSSNSADHGGGGMACFGSCEEDCTALIGSTFCGGNAEADGGKHLRDYALTLTNCTFSDNIAEDGGGVVWGDMSATLTGCTLSNNTARGGPDAGYGGGILCVSAPPATLTDCVFAANSAALTGGGFVCAYAAPLTLTNCTFSDNAAADGGGAAFLECYPTITSSTFSGNTSEDGGGILCGEGVAVTLTNCIIAFCGGGGAVSCGGAGSAMLFCSDVYGNVGGDWEDCIAGQDLYSGNFCADPLFCDAAGEDFTIDASSPCCAENNPACGLVGAWGIGCDTPVERTSWGSIKSMFR